MNTIFLSFVSGSEDGDKSGQRRRSKSNKKSVNAMSPVNALVQSPTSTSAAAAAAAAVSAGLQPDLLQSGSVLVKTEDGKTNEIGMVVDEDATTSGQAKLPVSQLHASAASGVGAGATNSAAGGGADDEAINGNSNTSMENWSEQPTMKVKVSGSIRRGLQGVLTLYNANFGQT